MSPRSRRARRGLRGRPCRRRPAARCRRRDERSLINLVKALGTGGAGAWRGLDRRLRRQGRSRQRRRPRAEPTAIHVAGGQFDLRELREQLKAERALGVGGDPHQGRRHERSERPGPITCSSASPVPTESLPALESVVERASWWAEIFETPCVAFAPSLDAIAGARCDAGGIHRARRCGLVPSGGPGRGRDRGRALIGDREATADADLLALRSRLVRRALRRRCQAAGPISPIGAYQRGLYNEAFREATLRLEKNKGDAAAMTLLGELYNQGLGRAGRPEEGRRMVSAGGRSAATPMRSRPSA